jgi:hypothetical protein
MLTELQHKIPVEMARNSEPQELADYSDRYVISKAIIALCPLLVFHL